jgi:hypothetical protein
VRLRWMTPDCTVLFVDGLDGPSLVLEPTSARWQEFCGRSDIEPFQPPDPALVLAEARAEAEAARRAAYAAEADPLFFRWQAGEAAKDEWLAKRAEIKARHPYPDSDGEAA